MPTNDENAAIDLYVSATLIASYPAGVTDLAVPLQTVLAARTETEWTARMQAVMAASETYRG